jgi:type II secretory pathway pseudopilin PulG
MRSNSDIRGFTYLALLFIVALMGVALAAGGVIWSVARQRDKERELLYVGGAFRKAIGSYYEGAPGSVKRYPVSFDDLLKDNRQLGTVRHLRRIYLDPMSSQPEWGIVRAPDGGIMGVYSKSNERPIKQTGFSLQEAAFESAQSYAEWRFIYEPASTRGLAR